LVMRTLLSGGFVIFCWGFPVQSAECSWSLSACYRIDIGEPQRFVVDASLALALSKCA